MLEIQMTLYKVQTFFLYQVKTGYFVFFMAKKNQYAKECQTFVQIQL